MGSMRCVIGFVVVAAVAAPAAAQLSYVAQARRVEAVPDNNPPPTQTTGQPSQEAPGFAPFAGSIDASFYWGQPGFDYGGQARVSQNSTLAPTGVAASGVVFATGDTVFTTGRSRLDATFDVAAPTPFTLAVTYDYSDYGDSGTGQPDAVVELSRVEAGSNTVLVRRQALFVLGTEPDEFDTTDAGVLTPGRYALSYLFQVPSNSGDKSFTYSAQLTVPEPALGLLPLAASLTFLSGRRRRRRY